MTGKLTAYYYRYVAAAYYAAAVGRCFATGRGDPV